MLNCILDILNVFSDTKNKLKISRNGRLFDISCIHMKTSKIEFEMPKQVF